MTARINVYCQDRGWLFRDLCSLYAASGAVVSSDPREDADAWVCIRTDEWERCPDPSRLVLQVHDLWAHAWPEAVGGIVLSHPDQRPACAAPLSMMRPLGALRLMRPFERRHRGTFTVGWVGRPANRSGEAVKAPGPLLAALREIAPSKPCRLILAGSSLLPYAEEAARIPGVETLYYHRSCMPLERYPELYAAMDVLCITSRIDAGPLSLFEALACGTPVLSTPVGWSTRLLNGENGWVYGHGELAAALEDARSATFAAPDVIRASLGDCWLDGPGGWIEQTLEMARKVAA
jgi:glycosyltransferase involved in cell wall biosynthesis